MPRQLPPQLICRKLPEFDVTDWRAVKSIFSHADGCELQQAWLEEKEFDFQPTDVRIGWRDEALCVYAELSDHDIFNAASHLNDATYAKGDIFEIFLRPQNQCDYFEFHITPDNVNLQLHWPDDKAVWNCVDTQESLAPYFVEEKIIESHTQVQAENHVWRVLARIPFCIISDVSTAPSDTWNFSFSRYDCMQGRNLPVWSSSSPHTEAKFHRQQEWGQMKFSSR